MGGHLGGIKALVRKTGYSTQATSLRFGLEVSDAEGKALLRCSVGQSSQGDLLWQGVPAPQYFQGPMKYFKSV